MSGLTYDGTYSMDAAVEELVLYAEIDPLAAPLLDNFREHARAALAAAHAAGRRAGLEEAAGEAERRALEHDEALGEEIISGEGWRHDGASEALETLAADLRARKGE